MQSSPVALSVNLLIKIKQINIANHQIFEVEI